MPPAAPVDRLRASCLVNNFDYAPYVVEAVQSALAQTRAFDEIVVVDDGSTDDSCERLRAAFGDEPRVTLIEKTNGGQLSCFHRGVEASTGEVVCFLDADDVYDPTYLETVLAVYDARADCHAVVSAYRTFGRQEGEVRRFPGDRDLGYSAVLALTRSLVKLWVSPTSTMSMRRTVLDRFLPLPRPADWRTRADDCLLFGSAFAGARKYYSAAPLVGYRVHDENRWYGRKFDASYEAEREAKIDRLLEDLAERLELGDLASHAAEEFALLRSPSLRQLRHYARLALGAETGIAARLGQVGAIVRHFATG